MRERQPCKLCIKEGVTPPQTVHALGVCRIHYDRIRAGIQTPDGTFIKPMRQPAKGPDMCQHRDCTAPKTKGDFCDKHVGKKHPRCTYEGCKKYAVAAHGMCWQHYALTRRYGNQKGENGHGGSK